jgi:hypothetical protein
LQDSSKIPVGIVIGVLLKNSAELLALGISKTIKIIILLYHPLLEHFMF